MDDQFFDHLEQALRSDSPGAGFDLLIREALAQKNYPLYFEIRLMQKRHELGLPLMDSGTISDLPPQHRSAYQVFIGEVARETGDLYLADGNIVRAWPYFHAIGDPAPVAAAIEKAGPGEGIEGVIEIALQGGVNPRKGFELLLEQQGTCQGIEFAVHYSDPANRRQFLQTLMRRMSSELATNLKEAIARVEGQVPETNEVVKLIAGRDWLFEGANFYVENSHLGTMLQVSPQLEDPETLRLALGMAEYGERLAPMLQFPSPPPFEDLYVDYAVYLRALLGEQVDAAVAHFRKKLDAGSPGAAEALVGLLARLNRYDQAIQVSIGHLRGIGNDRCPSAIQLCQRLGDYERLRQISRKQGDLLSFTAGILQG